MRNMSYDFVFDGGAGEGGAGCRITVFVGGGLRPKFS
jgi:hypothetical protein